MRLDDETARGEAVADDATRSLDGAVADLYAERSLARVMRRLLVASRGISGAVAGSVSIVDAGAGTYSKAAEVGVSCQLGKDFPLEEGVTGQAVARRRPVVVPDYRDVPGGHITGAHPAGRGTVVAVPIWWRDAVIGVNVAFAGAARRYGVAEVDALELLSQAGAAAIVRAGATDPLLARLIRARFHGHDELTRIDTRVTQAGTVRPVAPAVADAAADVAARAALAASQDGAARRVHVAVVYRSEGVRVLVQDDAPPPRDGLRQPDPLGLGTRTWSDLVARAGGQVSVQRVPGWGTLVRADIPYAPSAPPPSPLSPREGEVLALLARGHTDRRIAQELFLSPKTVEKHVASVLRKTGTASRTAAVVRALDHGWLTGPAG